MKFRATPLVYRAVCEGLINGFQDSKSAGDVPAEKVVEITADAIMQKLAEVLVFDEEEDHQRIHLMIQAMQKFNKEEETTPNATS